MSQIEKMLDVTSAFIKTVDKVDIELVTRDVAAPFVYLIQSGKSVSSRQQITSKTKKDGSNVIKFKTGCFDTLDGIYSWCGFLWLEVILEMPHTVDLRFQPKTMERKVLRFENTAPGWVDLPSIFLQFKAWPMNMTTIIKYEEISKIHEPYHQILTRGCTLHNLVRNELQEILERDVPYPDDKDTQ